MQGFWFGVIAILWAGFFVLEGFDYGVGMLLPLVGKTNEDRQIALRSIGPVWDGNEVWLLTAGGATFAAFPEWYSSVFSGFYLAFAMLLVGLILRGIGIEYRGHAETPAGRAWCDAGVVIGSLLPALLIGVAFGNFVRGVQLTPGHVMTNSFFSLLNPYALVAGLTTLSVFAFHGSTFLAFRTTGSVAARAQRLSGGLGPLATVIGLVFVIWTTLMRGGTLSVVLGVVVAAAVVIGAGAARVRRPSVAFAATAVAAALVPIWLFAALWPNVLPARNHAAWSLTVHNASSSHYTLLVMTVVALIFTPIVLLYQAWTYWVFRARVTGEIAQGHGYGGTGRASNVLHKAQQSAHDTLGRHPEAPDGSV